MKVELTQHQVEVLVLLLEELQVAVRDGVVDDNLSSTVRENEEVVEDIIEALGG